MNLKELYIIKLDVVHINVNAELNIKIYSNIKLLYTMYVLYAQRTWRYIIFYLLTCALSPFNTSNQAISVSSRS